MFHATRGAPAERSQEASFERKTIAASAKFPSLVSNGTVSWPRKYASRPATAGAAVIASVS